MTQILADLLWFTRRRRGKEDVLRCVQALRTRIRDAYEARWKAEKHFNEEAILQELPTALRIEVGLLRCNKDDPLPYDNCSSKPCSSSRL